MKLQELLWQKDEICTDVEMYFHSNYKIAYIRERNNYILFKEDGVVTADTYFNSLSIEKWKKYTQVENIALTLFVEGTFNICLCWKRSIGSVFIEKELKSVTVSASDKTAVRLEFPPESKGMLFFRIETLEKGSKFYGGYYESDVDDSAVNPVKLGIIICTFKREKFVCDNVRLLNQYIMENADSPLYGKLEIFIADNGKSLSGRGLESETVHIIENKNTGGSGGFTRGLIEIMKMPRRNGITHILLMDDDIVIDISSIVRTAVMLSLLKEKYKEAFIGGAMLRADQRNIQVESGAVWNGGKIHSLKAGLDLRLWENCLDNEQEEYREYNAWWYCCFPVDIVREDNLPLPLFIRGDDVEYGLRNMKNLILINGICVWHEPFENKYASFLEYYIIRNRLINNAFYVPGWGRLQTIKELLHEYIREGYLYRYKNIELYIRGIQDFLKGIDFLKQTDAELLHKEIISQGYKILASEELEVAFFRKEYERGRTEYPSKFHNLIRKITLNGYLLPAKHIRTVPISQPRLEFVWRAKTILFYDIVESKGFVTHRSLRCFVKLGFRVIFLIFEILIKYEKARRSYTDRGKEIKCLDFWKKYLDL